MEEDTATVIGSLDIARWRRLYPYLALAAAVDRDWLEGPAHGLTFGELEALVAGLMQPRQEVVIRLRFAIPRDGLILSGQSLENVARELGVTRERVRQIEARALENIRKAIARAREEV